MKAKAYLIAEFDPYTLKVTSIAFYSERYPTTTNTQLIQACILEAEGDDYEKAKFHLMKRIAADGRRWAPGVRECVLSGGWYAVSWLP